MAGLFPQEMEGSAGIRLLLAAVYVGICAVQDLKRRKISLPVTVCAGCAAFLLDIPIMAKGGENIFRLIPGMLPGAMFLLLSLAAEGAAGKGDGYCFLVLGALLTEEIEDLVPAAVPEDLVAVDDLVVAPALDLVMEELLVPALLETEPMPLLVVEPVVATLGL